MLPKVLVLILDKFREDLLPPEVVDHLRSFAEVRIVVDPDKLSPERWSALFPGMDAVVTSWNIPGIGRSDLEKADCLKIIAHAAGMVRPYITEEIFELRPEIVICNASNVMARPVAEHTLLMSLACLRQLRFFEQWVRDGQWWDYPPEKNRSLLHKKVGIIGMGQIAREFIDLVRPFELQLLVFSRHLAREDAERQGLVKSSLEEIFSTCEVITLSAANTPENRHLVSRDLLRRIKPGAVFVNNSRGAIVDEQALIEELETGRFMAALDVTEPEPPEADNKLRRMPNVLLTPHIGGPTPDQRIWMMKEVVDNLEAFFQGKPVRNRIDRQRYLYMA